MLKKSIILIAGTLILFLVILLSGPSIGLKNGYRSFFLKTSEILFSEIGKDGHVIFSRLDNLRYHDLDLEAGIYSDTQVKKAKRKAAKVGKKTVDIQPMGYRFSSWSRGFTPTLFLFCLILFSAFSWKRKLIGMVISLGLLHVLIFAHLWHKLLWQFQGSQSSAKMYDKESFFHSYLKFFEDTFPQSLDVFFIAAFIIWLLVMFRKADFEDLVARIREKSSS